ncbi:MAG: hypothetical protein MJ025_04015 [Victivallaceae bacterium]|nr:hypothetical protein [Victivallaceae bacterium]
MMNSWMLRGIAVSALAAGCLTLHAATPMDTAISELSTGGDYFSLTNAKPVNELVWKFISAFAEAPEKAEAPDEQKKLVGNIVTAVAVSLQKAGLNEISVYGGSSVKNGDIYHNRGVAVLDQEHPGIAWTIPETYDGNILDLLGESFPADVEMAIVVGIDLRPLHKMASQFIAKWQEEEKLKDEIVYLSGLVETLLDTHGQLFVATLYDDSTYIGYPDPEGKIFDTLREYLKSTNALGAMEADTVTVCNGDVSITKGKGVMHVVRRDSEPSAKGGNKGLLKDNDRFASLSSGLSGRGCFLAIYMPEAEHELDILGYPLSFDGKLGNDLVATVSFDGNKLVYDGNGTLSWPQSHLSDAILLPLIVLDMAMSPNEQVRNLLDDANEEFAENQTENENKDAEHLAVCMENLKAIGAAIAKLEKEGRQLPGDVAALAAATGIKNVWDCPSGLEDNIGAAGNKYSDYIYFGPWTGFDDPKLPVLVDWPGNHVDKFNVLYVDGTVETLDMENITSIRKQASKLHSVHNYQESTFAELLRRADKLDSEFELEQHHEQ